MQMIILQSSNGYNEAHFEQVQDNRKTLITNLVLLQCWYSGIKCTRITNYSQYVQVWIRNYTNPDTVKITHSEASTHIVETLESIGARKLSSLNIPPTSFTNSCLNHETRSLISCRMSVQFTEPICNTHSPPIINRPEIDDSLSTSSPLLDDSLFTVYNTLMASHLPRASNDTHDILDTMADISFNDGFPVDNSNPPSISNKHSFFFRPSPMLAVTPTCHIRKSPHTMKMTQFFSPPSQQKSKSRKNEGSEARNAKERENVLTNKETPSTFLKRNKRAQ